MHFWIARNYSQSPRGDSSYVVTLEEPRAFVDSRTGDVKFTSEARWTTYIKAHRPSDFEGRYPHLRLKPGEGPYKMVTMFAEFPRLESHFAGKTAACLSDATGHAENKKKEDPPKAAP